MCWSEVRPRAPFTRLRTCTAALQNTVTRLSKAQTLIGLHSSTRILPFPNLLSTASNLKRCSHRRIFTTPAAADQLLVDIADALHCFMRVRKALARQLILSCYQLILFTITVSLGDISEVESVMSSLTMPCTSISWSRYSPLPTASSFRTILNGMAS